MTVYYDFIVKFPLRCSSNQTPVSDTFSYLKKILNEFIPAFLKTNFVRKFFRNFFMMTAFNQLLIMLSIKCSLGVLRKHSKGFINS